MTSLSFLPCLRAGSLLQTIVLAGGLIFVSTSLHATFITRAQVVQYGVVGQSNAVSQNGTPFGGSGENFSSCGGTFNAGGTATSSTASVSCGSLLSFGSADLVTGTLHGSAVSSLTAGVIGIGNTNFVEQVTFNNLTAGSLLLNISWVVEGSTLGTEVSINSNLDLQNVSGSILLQGSTASVLADHISFSDLRGSQGVTVGEGSGAWIVSGVASPVGSTLQSTLVIPPGKATVQIAADLNLDCRVGARCDFSNTGKFAFGTLPTGLSFTSDSGVFLSGASPAVPEPGTLAMLTIGLLSAGILRRRTKG